MPLAEDAPAAFIFSRRQLRQRQPSDSAPAVGIGMTCGSSAHQQPLSCLQVIGASHWEQRVSTGRLWGGGRRTSSVRQFAAWGAGGFLVSGAKRVISWIFASGSRNERGGVFLAPAITYGKFKLLMRTPDIRPYKGRFPQIAASAYIDPAAVVIGDVVIGEESSVWPMTVVRGDVHHIRIGKRTNIQDGCVLHVMKDQYPLLLGDEVTVGHSVTLHGCNIHSHVLIGMGCIILNGAVIGENSIIAAGTLITERTVIPSGSLVMGSPGKVKRELTDEDCESISKYAERYAGYSVIYREEAAERGEQIDWSKLED